jgi:hypothetical protein
VVELLPVEAPLELLALELPAGAFDPFGWTAYHRPPYVFTPLPVTSPGLVSAV